MVGLKSAPRTQFTSELLQCISTCMIGFKISTNELWKGCAMTRSQLHGRPQNNATAESWVEPMPSSLYVAQGADQCRSYHGGIIWGRMNEHALLSQASYCQGA